MDRFYKRKIGLSIFLSLITLGIYGIYWKYLIIKNIRTLQKDDSRCAGELLCLVFLPFYSLYWWYTRGHIVETNFSKNGNSASGTKYVYLVLGILGLEIVSMAIIQHDFNSLPSDVLKSNKQNLKKLTLCSVMVALATVLSLIKVWQMPLGGSITLLSMLPIIIIPYILDTKWGLVSSFVYSLMQLGLGIMTEGVLSWGLSPLSLVGTIFLDYIIPFTLLGLAGVFAKKHAYLLIPGTAMVLILRFLCHFVSGIIIFDIWCEWDSVWIYSLCYNGAFMLPELIFTTVAVALLSIGGALKRIKRITER